MIAPFYFSSSSGRRLLTNDSGAYFFLSEKDFQDFICERIPKGSEILNRMTELGFWYDGNQESFLRESSLAYISGNNYLFDATSLFIFAVTNECNNRCIYCQANGIESSCKMTIEVAEQALKQISRCAVPSLTIEFQGGEPLLNFPVIQYIVENTREIMPEKDVHFTVVSNLALLTEEMACFFAENKVNVSTSLDGPDYLHDINRPAANGSSSFAAMISGKNILSKYGIRPGAIETTTAQSLKYPKEIVHSYVENGFGQIFLRPLTRLGAAAKCWDKVGYRPENFIQFYRQALEEIITMNRNGIPLMEYHAALFLTKILNRRAVNYMELRSPCGAGIGQMAITAHGDVYTCDEGRMMAEMGDEAFRIGNVFEGDYSKWIEAPSCRATCAASLLESLPGCCDCVYKPYCGICPVINYAINGNTTSVSKDRCRIYSGILETLFNYLYQSDPFVMSLFHQWAEQG